MDFNELADLIKTRRSIRRWQDKPVPEDLLLKAIELATWAPNGGNQQNWRFYVITNKGIITKIADAVFNTSNLISTLPAAEKLGVSARIKEGAGFFRTAPAAIAIAASRYQSVVDQVLAADERPSRGQPVSASGAISPTPASSRYHRLSPTSFSSCTRWDWALSG
ncbi:MAG: nitroreductase family protein [Chloroflexota bacterium]